MRYTMIEGIVLKFAFTGLVTNRTIQRVISQKKLHGGSACSQYLLGFRIHFHPFADRPVAGNDQFGHSVDLDQAHSAITVYFEVGVVTEMRNRDSVMTRGFYNGHPRFERSLIPIQSKRGHDYLIKDCIIKA